MTTENKDFNNKEKQNEWESFFKEYLGIIGKGILTGASLYCGSALAGSFISNRPHKSLPDNVVQLNPKKISNC